MKLRYWSALLGLVLAGSAYAQYVRVDGEGFVGSDGQAFHIRGTNLGNWLVPEGYMWRLDDAHNAPREIEALVELLLGPDQAASFWHEYRERYVSEADVKFLANAGCNTIRVPLHYKFFLEDQGEGFRLLDRLVTWSRANHLHLILDMHCAPGGQTGTNIDDSLGYPWLLASPASQQQLVEVWTRLARHYRDEPVVLGYDLLNEPLPAFPGWEQFKPALEPLLQRVLVAVRAVDANHVIFLTGANWDSDFSIVGPPPEKNVAYTFHKYWVPPVETAIQPYLDFRARYHVPIWAGETGENKDEWIATFRQLLEKHDIGWTFWPYKKMQSTAGFVRFMPPANWEKMVAFAKRPVGTGSDRVKAGLPLRPPQGEIEACFADLLRRIQLENCEPNRGYIEALGLTVPHP